MGAQNIENFVTKVLKLENRFYSVASPKTKVIVQFLIFVFRTEYLLKSKSVNL